MSESKASDINSAGMTPLHLAAIRGDSARVQQLLADSRTHPDQLNHAGEPALFGVLRLSAAAGPEVIPGRERIFNQLWDVTTPEIRVCQDKLGGTILHLMAADGFDKLTREVLAKEPGLASKHLFDNTRDYPIHTAIGNGYLDVAEALFDLDPETATYLNVSDQCPLHLAAQSASKEMLELCCTQHIGDINQVDINGRTALALLRGRGDLTEDEKTDFEGCLVAKGAQEGANDSRRMTKNG
ncbi:MAG: ankyrin repeat domain-containing protein [Gammaproteobacteria bacterium]|nr:ankyrin repeat domain-containing protein [Gammaproteobacteria bacterium]